MFSHLKFSLATPPTTTLPFHRSLLYVKLVLLWICMATPLLRPVRCVRSVADAAACRPDGIVSKKRAVSKGAFFNFPSRAGAATTTATRLRSVRRRAPTYCRAQAPPRSRNALAVRLRGPGLCRTAPAAEPAGLRETERELALAARKSPSRASTYLHPSRSRAGPCAALRCAAVAAARPTAAPEACLAPLDTCCHPGRCGTRGAVRHRRREFFSLLPGCPFSTPSLHGRIRHPAPPPRSVVSDSRCLHVTAHSRSAIVVAALADLPATIPSHPLEASTNLTCHVPTNHPLPLGGWLVRTDGPFSPSAQARQVPGWYSTPWWLVRTRPK